MLLPIFLTFRLWAIIEIRKIGSYVPCGERPLRGIIYDDVYCGFWIYKGGVSPRSA